MKSEIEQLIDRLASKELTRGCKLRIKNGELYERLYAAMDEAAPVREGSEFFQDTGIVEVLQYNDPSPIADTGDYSDELLDVWLEDGPYGCGVFDLVDLCGNLFIEPWEQIEILGHPILKCHVENILWRNKGEHISFDEVQVKLKALNYLWWACGEDSTKSLQSIFEEAEWEGACPLHPSHIPSIKSNQAIPVGICTDCWNLSVSTNLIQIPKQKSIRELFEFLLNLNLAE